LTVCLEKIKIKNRSLAISILFRLQNDSERILNIIKLIYYKLIFVGDIGTFYDIEIDLNIIFCSLQSNGQVELMRNDFGTLFLFPLQDKSVDVWSLNKGILTSWYAPWWYVMKFFIDISILWDSTEDSQMIKFKVQELISDENRKWTIPQSVLRSGLPSPVWTILLRHYDISLYEKRNWKLQHHYWCE